MPHIFFRFFIILLFSFVALKAEQLTDSFRLDAYGNITMHENQTNTDRFRVTAGFQGRYQFSENISITGQMHFEEGQNSQEEHSNSLEDYDSELKWFYIDYYLQNDITLRAGGFQFPVFKSSEMGDIGYTYTWTNTPLRYYGVFGCDDFEGIELLKNFSYNDFDFLVQLSYGKSNNELNDGRGDSREGDVEDLIGLTLKTSHDDFILNIGYLQAKSTMDTTNPFVTIEPNVDFNMIALESEIYVDDFTLKSGLIKTDLSNIYPEDLNYYASLEYNFGDFTPYILYSNEISNFKDAPTNKPPRREVRVQKQSNEKYSLGLRYDYSANVAFKVSYTYDNRVIEYDGFDDEKTSDNTFMGSINVIF